MKNLTPKELFEEYASFGDCTRLYDPNETKEIREKRHAIADELRETNHIVAWHPDSGIFLHKVQR
jgi:hypothetical protein